MAAPGTRRALFAALVLLAACGPATDKGEDRAPTNDAVAQRLPLPIAEPPLDRAALLEAAARAASAAALGRDDRDAQRPLEGDQFELRIRFGCPGAVRPGAAAGPFRIAFEPDSRTLRLSAAPDLVLDEPWIARLGGQGVEAVEGFWMRRPWLLAPGCTPASPSPPQPAIASKQAAPDEPAIAPASGHRVGIAQFFTEADARTRRRDSRPYEATATLDEGEQPSAQGYDLVLTGRLRLLADGRIISCRVASADVPPDCVIAAEFDRVRLEHPGTREALAEWGGG